MCALSIRTGIAVSVLDEQDDEVLLTMLGILRDKRPPRGDDDDGEG
jgi:hypothetical protein